MRTGLPFFCCSLITTLVQAADLPRSTPEELGVASAQVLEFIDAVDQIGRNDPCWCGSGKKFKKCHGAGQA